MVDRIEITGNVTRVDQETIVNHLRSGGAVVFEPPIDREQLTIPLRPKPIIDGERSRRTASDHFDSTVLGRVQK